MRHAVVRFRRLPVSARIDVRVVVLAVATAAVALIVAAYSMTVGDFPVPLPEVLKAVVGAAEGTVDLVVRSFRMPRVLTAGLVGLSLALSGAIFQGLVRNPLVSPDIIGINAGASAVAVFLLVTGGSTLLLPAAAFAGALTAAVAIYVLAWRRGVSPNRLVLVGIGINALLAAVTTYLIVRYPIEEVSSAVLWTTGTLFASGWEDVIRLGVSLAVLVPATVALGAHLHTLQLGDDAARALGVKAELARAGLLLCGVGLAAVAVATGGPIAFVALISPHIARLLAGKSSTGVLLVAAGVGATMLLVSDLIAQRLFAPLSLPAGVVTAGVGGPYFLFLLYRRNRAL